MSHIKKGTVEFEQVSKRYRLGTLGTLRETLSTLLAKNGGSDDRRRILWALQDVTFRVEPGESLGLIGPNGAGKTTTLKLLSKITQPTSGRVSICGRVSSLIELGAGFHPELTGRENIYLNGAVLGLKRHEIRRKLDVIIAFSELERFIDTPVKRYSSGMYVRLGFAVAAYVEPDILLVDEVLAVGDASFRHRCIRYMRELRQKGTTVVFVSHNLHQVRDMCEKVLLLMNGQIRAEGAASAVIAEYQRLLLAGEPPGESQDGLKQPDFDSQGSLILKDIEIKAPNQNAREGLVSHLPAQLRIYYEAVSPQPIGRIDIRILRDDGTLCSAIDSIGTANGNHQFRQISGKGVIEVSYEPVQLTSGKYVVMVQMTDPGDSIVVASGQSRPFYVYENYRVPPMSGIYIPLVHWSIHSLDA